METQESEPGGGRLQPLTVLQRPCPLRTVLGRPHGAHRRGSGWRHAPENRARTLVWTVWGDRGGGGGAQWQPGSRVRVDKVESKQGPAPVASTPAL